MDYNSDFTNMLKLSNQAQYLLIYKRYDSIFYNSLIDSIYYYKTCICFDYTSEIYSYCSMKNIKKIYNIELEFKSLINKVETNADKYYYMILESYIRLFKMMKSYLDNFDKYQEYNINIIINKLIKISI